MFSRPFNRWVIWILIIATVMRLGFLVFGEVLPVMWDARKYVAGGIGLLSYIYPPTDTDIPDEYVDRQQFRELYDKKIQGERIEWLSYKPHTLTEAKEEIYFSGPLYPAVLATIFMIAPANDFTIVRLFGVFLDLLCNLLIMLIGIRLIGRTPALVAGLMYAIYFPFILSSTMLLLETSTSFLILLTIYLFIRASENYKHKYLILAGITTGLLLLNKPTATLLVIPLLAGFYFYVRAHWQNKIFVSRILWYLAPFGLITAVWLTITSIHFGQIAIRDPNYSGANLRQSTSIIYEGYDLDMVEKDFWTRSIAGDILDDPIGYGGLLIKKFDRLWRRPFNDFKKEFIIPYEVNEGHHLVLVIFGLMGLLLLMRLDFRLAAWLLFIIGYYTVIHLVFHSISRYNFNAMPMVLLAGAYMIALIWDSFVNYPMKSKVMILSSLFILVLSITIGTNWIQILFNSELNQLTVIITILIKIILFLSGLLLLTKVVKYESYPIGRSLMILGCLVIVAPLMASHTLSRDNWAEFKTQIDSTDIKAGTRIYISNLVKIRNGDSWDLVIDLNSGRNRSNSFNVKVGNENIKLVGGKEPLQKMFYPKPTYLYYSKFIPMGIEEYRQYAIIPIQNQFIMQELIKSGYLDISISINEEFNEPNNYVNLWGNYSTDEDSVFIPAVRFVSIERFVHQNDPRIRYPVKYASDSTISYYINQSDNIAENSIDLSSSPGIQTGRYNIFLMLFRKDGEFVVY